MEIEYSAQKGKNYAFTFDDWEAELIIKALQPEINKIYRRIKHIRENPKNEGQATFARQIDELHAEIRAISKMQEDLKPPRKTPQKQSNTSTN